MAAENNDSPAGSYFYSDSINDLPLLLEVSHPVAVDPDDALCERSHDKGLGYYFLRDYGA